MMSTNATGERAGSSEEDLFDDFSLSHRTPQRRRLSLSLRRNSSHRTQAGSDVSSRLCTAISMARATIRSSEQSSIATELGRRFNNGGSSGSSYSRSERRQRRRGQVWKVIPCSLPGPNTVKVPTKGALNDLCKVGLGTLWFSAIDKLEVHTAMTPEEFHFLLLCLYPMLKDVPYELCKAAGPGHNVVIPLSIDDESFHPDSTRPFSPYFSPDEAKKQIGRKGRLYIRPAVELSVRNLPRFLEHEVYRPRSAIPCCHCDDDDSAESSTSTQRGSNIHPQSNTQSLPHSNSRQPSDNAQSVDNLQSQSVSNTQSDSNQIETTDAVDPYAIAADVEVIASDNSVIAESEHEATSPTNSSPLPIFHEVSTVPESPNYTMSPSVADNVMEVDHEQTIPSSLQMYRQIRQEQDEAYQESLRTDQERERRRIIESQIEADNAAEIAAEQREEEELRIRIQQWHQRIRQDLANSVPEEPPNGHVGNISVRIRLPTGERVSRIFRSSHTVGDLYAYVGSLRQINPRHYRLLIGTVPQPSVLSRQSSHSTLSDAGFGPLTLVIAENLQAPGVEGSLSESIEDNSLEGNLLASETTHDQGGPVQVGETGQEDTSNHNTTSSDEVQPISTVRELEEFRQQLRSALVRRGIFRMQVNRPTVFEELLDVYSNNPQVVSLEPRVRFVNELGMDGGGLKREVITTFWQLFQDRLLEGEREKVPILSPEYGSKYYHIGRILSHGYLLTGFFPLCFNKPFTLALLVNTDAVSDDMLIESFLEFVADFEADAVKKCLDGDQSVINDTIVPMLSRFNSRTRPTCQNIRHIILNTAKYALVHQPYFVLQEMRRGMLDSHPRLWKSFKSELAHNLLNSLQPTPQRVWNMICETSFRNKQEEKPLIFFDVSFFSLTQICWVIFCNL